jgi:aminopeptidase N
VPAGSSPATVVVTYRFHAHDALDGWSPTLNLTFLWPYFCANLFPCHSRPDDGATFEMRVTGVPEGKTAVFPARIPRDAPSYMPAIAVGDYRHTALGVTPSGTKVGYYALPTEVDGGIVAATAKLVDIVGFYEKTLGPYMFGDEIAAVDVKWPPNAYGGMEHHPYFHVADRAIGKEYVHAHEAAHGWYGDGVRIKCWEDWVLSEGTVSYLAARATEVVRGTAAASALWTNYRAQLDAAVKTADTRAWPQTCNAIDINSDPLKSTIPYMKGAFFYRKVAATIGAAKLDDVLAKFYVLHQGSAASMGDMLALIRTESGFDPTALATRYLQSLGNPEL